MYLLKIKNFFYGINFIYYGHIKNNKSLFIYSAYSYYARGKNNKALHIKIRRKMKQLKHKI